MGNRKNWLKSSLFIWAVLPLIYLGFLISTGNLGTNPQEYIERYLGTCTLVLLLVTYSISVRSSRVIPHLTSCRRMVGLFSFVYMTCHFFAYIIFEHSFVMVDFLKDFMDRPFVFFGTLAFFLTIPLAFTSNTVSMKILGKWWKKLHSMITVIILLSLAHYFFHKAGKNDFFWPFFASAVFGILYVTKKRDYSGV
ncbi:sulfoxide reductase heme-binding subunit YedZ, partial [Betaproteobacteria bacterium]|nr:sulfoxide reductase heme-binding subunit YedZ [Betaproteobacteria bacterium]